MGRLESTQTSHNQFSTSGNTLGFLFKPEIHALHRHFSYSEKN